MDIQLTFDSFDDYYEGIRKLAGILKDERPAEPKEEPVYAVKEPVLTAQHAPEPAKTAEISAKTAEIPAEAETAPEPKVDMEALKLETKKLLSKLNKKTGTNTASQLIQEICGVKRFTEVSEDKLPALRAKAEEGLNAG